MAGELRAQSPREGVGTSLPNLERLTYDDPTPAVSLQETVSLAVSKFALPSFRNYAMLPALAIAAARLVAERLYHGRKDVGP